MTYKDLIEMINGFRYQNDIDNLTVVDSAGRDINFVGVENRYLIIGNERAAMGSKKLWGKVKGNKNAR